MRHFVPAKVISFGAFLLLCVIGIGCMHEKEKKAVKVRFDQLPATAQQTFRKESNGAAIAEVDEEHEKDKSIYEADVQMDGKNWEIKVAADGTLMSKKLDEEVESKEKGK